MFVLCLECVTSGGWGVCRPFLNTRVKMVPNTTCYNTGHLTFINILKTDWRAASVAGTSDHGWCWTRRALSWRSNEMISGAWPRTGYRLNPILGPWPRHAHISSVLATLRGTQSVRSCDAVRVRNRMHKGKLQQLQAEPISRDIGNIIIRVGARVK